ncbi:putative arylsulfatase regulatory protein [Vibrio ishigakensis]|uniref:Putative arylsulfatase regulatory protein n=1 Tax=Vibrio ishigakensis TaxID=1481914 RepID=A0A0B8PEJ5_9VIBR|nr:putative arylsulfatase regulatory protein [Vibrio ishigakensis]
MCNIDCSYCYYLGKQQLLDYDKREEKRMSFELLEKYIKQYIEGQNTPEIVFTWHGGEPLFWVWSILKRWLSCKLNTAQNTPA